MEDFHLHHEQLAPFTAFLRQRSATQCGKRQRAMELTHRLLHCGVHVRVHAESGTYAAVMSLSQRGFLLSSSSPASPSPCASSFASTHRAVGAAESHDEDHPVDVGDECASCPVESQVSHRRQHRTTSCHVDSHPQLLLPWSTITSVSLESYAAAATAEAPSTTSASPTRSNSADCAACKDDDGQPRDAHAEAAEGSLPSATSSYVCVETVFADVLLLKPIQITATAERLLEEHASRSPLEAVELSTLLLTPPFWVETIHSRIGRRQPSPSSSTPLPPSQRQSATTETSSGGQAAPSAPSTSGGTENSPLPLQQDIHHVDRVAAAVAQLQRLLHDKQQRIQLLSQEVHRMRGGSTGYAAALAADSRGGWSRYGGLAQHVQWAASDGGAAGDERARTLNAVDARREGGSVGHSFFCRDAEESTPANDDDNDDDHFEESAIGPAELIGERPWTAGGFLAPPSAQLADAALAALPEHPRYSSSSSPSSSSSEDQRLFSLPSGGAAPVANGLDTVQRHVDAASTMPEFERFVATPETRDSRCVPPAAEGSGRQLHLAQCVVDDAHPASDAAPRQRVRTSPATTRAAATSSSSSSTAAERLRRHPETSDGPRMPSAVWLQSALPPAAPIVWEGIAVTNAATPPSGTSALALQGVTAPPGTVSPPRTSSAPTSRRKPQQSPQHEPPQPQQPRDHQPPTRGALRSRGVAQQEPQPGSAIGQPRGSPGGVWQRPAAPRPAARGAVPGADATRITDSRQLGLGLLEPRATRQDLQHQPELLRLYNDIHGSQSDDSDMSDDVDVSNTGEFIVPPGRNDHDEAEEFDDGLSGTH